MIQSVYNDIQKAPFFNILLLLTVFSLQVGRGFFYFFLSLILLYFLIDLSRTWKVGLENIKNIIIDLKHISIAFSLIFITMTLANLSNDYSNLIAWSYEVKFFLKVPIFLLILLYFYNKRFFTPQTLYFFIACSIFIHALDGLYQALYGYDFFRGMESTLCEGLTGATKNRNDFGFLIGFGIFFILGLIFNTNKYTEKWLYALCGMLIMFCLLYSLSRAAWLAILISLSFLLVYHLSKTNYKNSLFIIFYAVILVGSSFSIDCLSTRTTNLIESTSLVGTTSLAESTHIAETSSLSLAEPNILVEATSHAEPTSLVEPTRLTSTTSLLTEDASTYERVQIWGAAIEMIAQKPTFGWGMEKMYQFGSFSNHTHNIAIEIALHTGLIGLIAFLYCLYQIFRSIIINKQITLLSVLMYVVIKCSLDHTLFSGNFVPASLVAILFYTFSESLRIKQTAKLV